MKISDTTISRDHTKCWHLTKNVDSLQLSLWQKPLTKNCWRNLLWGNSQRAFTEGVMAQLLVCWHPSSIQPRILSWCFHVDCEPRARAESFMTTAKARLKSASPWKQWNHWNVAVSLPWKKSFEQKYTPCNHSMRKAFMLTIWWLFLLLHFIKQFVHSTIFCLWALVREPKSCFEAFTVGCKGLSPHWKSCI